MKDCFFNFLLDGVVAFVIGILTYLIAQDAVGTGSMAAAGFAGISSGVATCLSYEFGKNAGWISRKFNVIAGILGAVVGGGIAACIGIG